MNSYAETNIGNVRKLNEDYVYASNEPVGPLPNLYIVADGMGGHQGGDYASRFVVEELVERIRRSDSASPINLLNRVISEVNTALYHKSCVTEELKGMGTTLVVATVTDQSMFVANIGDSRLYRMSRELHQITRDHSWVEEMIREGKIARDSALYYQKKNIITRAVGVYSRVTADFFEVDLEEGDKILMCSDGLCNMVEDTRIEEILRENDNLAWAGRELVAAAKQNGGKDNISVVLFAAGEDRVTA